MTCGRDCSRSSLAKERHLVKSHFFLFSFFCQQKTEKWQRRYRTLPVWKQVIWKTLSVRPRKVVYFHSKCQNKTVCALWVGAIKLSKLPLVLFWASIALTETQSDDIIFGQASVPLPSVIFSSFSCNHWKNVDTLRSSLSCCSYRRVSSQRHSTHPWTRLVCQAMRLNLLRSRNCDEEAVKWACLSKHYVPTLHF